MARMQRPTVSTERAEFYRRLLQQSTSTIILWAFSHLFENFDADARSHFATRLLPIFPKTASIIGAAPVQRTSHTNDILSKNWAPQSATKTRNRGGKSLSVRYSDDFQWHDHLHHLLDARIQDGKWPLCSKPSMTTTWGPWLIHHQLLFKCRLVHFKSSLQSFKVHGQVWKAHKPIQRYALFNNSFWIVSLTWSEDIFIKSNVQTNSTVQPKDLNHLLTTFHKSDIITRLQSGRTVKEGFITCARTGTIKIERVGMATSWKNLVQTSMDREGNVTLWMDGFMTVSDEGKANCRAQEYCWFCRLSLLKWSLNGEVEGVRGKEWAERRTTRLSWRLRLDSNFLEATTYRNINGDYRCKPNKHGSDKRNQVVLHLHSSTWQRQFSLATIYSNSKQYTATIYFEWGCAIVHVALRSHQHVFNDDASTKPLRITAIHRRDLSRGYDASLDIDSWQLSRDSHHTLTFVRWQGTSSSSIVRRHHHLRPFVADSIISIIPNPSRYLIPAKNVRLPWPQYFRWFNLQSYHSETRPKN